MFGGLKHAAHSTTICLLMRFFCLTFFSFSLLTGTKLNEVDKFEHKSSHDRGYNTWPTESRDPGNRGEWCSICTFHILILVNTWLDSFNDLRTITEPFVKRQLERWKLSNACLSNIVERLQPLTWAEFQQQKMWKSFQSTHDQQRSVAGFKIIQFAQIDSSPLKRTRSLSSSLSFRTL